LSQARIGARPRATAIGATWEGNRARFAIHGYHTETTPRATAIGAHWGDTRARCSRANRDRCVRKGIHIWGNNRGCHRAF